MVTFLGSPGKELLRLSLHGLSVPLYTAIRAFVRKSTKVAAVHRRRRCLLPVPNS